MQPVNRHHRFRCCCELYCDTLGSCIKFLALSPTARREYALQARICLNCLARSHLRERCLSTLRCRICGRNHHSLLHIEPGTTELPNSNQRHNVERPVMIDAAVQRETTPYTRRHVLAPINIERDRRSTLESRRVALTNVIEALEELQSLL